MEQKPLTVIALHGPPRCGKNEVVKAIMNNTRVLRKITSNLPRRRFKHLSFSQPMKDFFHEIVGMTFLEDEKDIPFENIGGKKPRDGYIYMGQMDEIFGGDLWARYAWQKRNDGLVARKEGFEGIVYESVGRQGQWDYFMGLRDQGLIDTRLIEVSRPGVTWTDNRHAIHDPELTKCAGISNAGTIEELNQLVKELVPWLLA